MRISARRDMALVIPWATDEDRLRPLAVGALRHEGARDGTGRTKRPRNCRALQHVYVIDGARQARLYHGGILGAVLEKRQTVD
jgi:hypothetical protein